MYALSPIISSGEKNEDSMVSNDTGWSAAVEVAATGNDKGKSVKPS
jgi:hypothetical protein